MNVESRRTKPVTATSKFPVCLRCIHSAFAIVESTVTGVSGGRYATEVEDFNDLGGPGGSTTVPDRVIAAQSHELFGRDAYLYS